MFRRIFLTTIASTMLFMSGCAVTPFIGPILGVGLAWVGGEAHKYYHADQQTVIDAVKNGANDLEFSVVDISVKGNTTKFKVDDQSTNENRFKIKITKIQHNVTKLSIRINTWGDKPYAELMYKKVDEYPGVKSFKTTKELEDAYHGR